MKKKINTKKKIERNLRKLTILKKKNEKFE